MPFMNIPTELALNVGTDQALNKENSAGNNAIFWLFYVLLLKWFPWQKPTLSEQFSLD